MNSPAYRITLVGDVPKTIRALDKKAAARGQKKAYRDAFLAIEKRISENPVEFGECCYHLLSGDLRCQVGAIRPVVVQFAIHEKRREVFLLNVFLLGS